MMSAIAAAVAGVGPAGFMTTVLPNASAGADFHAGIAIGKFHGVMSPNTPTGSREVVTSTPGRVEVEILPVTTYGFAREVLEDPPCPRNFADSLRQRLALLA